MSARSNHQTIPAKRPWTAPKVEDLAPLQDLTLQSPIEGGEGGFGWLDVTRPTPRLG